MSMILCVWSPLPHSLAKVAYETISNSWGTTLKWGEGGVSVIIISQMCDYSCSSDFSWKQPIFLQLVLVQSKEAKLTLNEESYIQCASSTPTPLKKIKSTTLPLAFTTHKLYWQPNRKMIQNVVHLCLAVPYGGKLQQGINNHFSIKKTNRIFFLHYSRSVALIHLNLVD